MAHESMADPREPEGARLVSVIETISRVGSGQSERDPVRHLRRYWTADGQLLAEKDEFLDDPARTSQRTAKRGRMAAIHQGAQTLMQGLVQGARTGKNLVKCPFKNCRQEVDSRGLDGHIRLAHGRRKPQAASKTRRRRGPERPRKKGGR